MTSVTLHCSACGREALVDPTRLEIGKWECPHCGHVEAATKRGDVESTR